MVSVKYNHVSKIIKGKSIVNDVSFEVEQGEIFGLLGPNGAGKTSLMKLTVGLLSLSEGSIEIMGNSVTENFCEAMRQVGILLEQPAIYPYMSGYDNLHIMAKALKLPKSKIDEVVEIVGLEQSIKQETKSYSLGMKQRLGIALALLKNPSVVILDEPTNGLDPQGIMEFRKYMKWLAAEKNITVIVSSHLLTEMSMLCDRFAIIQGGSIRKIVTKEESEQLQGRGQIQFEVDEIEKAKKIVEQNKLTIESIEGNRIVVMVDRDQIAVINRMFVKEGLKVYSIMGIGNSLENYYFQIVHQDEINK
jgi:ABC-2 type transport system ATP-binding protein